MSFLTRVAALTAVVSLFVSSLCLAEPLRVDINSQNRSDMRSTGCENWRPTSDELSRAFGDIRVTLAAPAAGQGVDLVGAKSLVVDGLTLGADGARVLGGGEPAVLEVKIQGLPAGSHTFAGYHHAPSGEPGELRVSVAGQGAESRVVPTIKATHDDELAASFIRFEAAAGSPVVIRITATEGDRVPLNGFELDAPDPTRSARVPTPAHLERHADGDNGVVRLSWRPADSAVEHHVYLTKGASAAEAVAALDGADTDSESYLAHTTGDACTAPIKRNDSLVHYAWRVDSIDSDGQVTTGTPWVFRVRHLAFPTAEGWGRFAIGGRGGRVLHVTNLNDTGPGSLRAAVEATGPRTVVFDVSGLITLESRLTFSDENEFLTVAGQTAPGKGICLRGQTFGGSGGNDTIVRFVRMRMGDKHGGRDGMGLAASDHCIVDHCSISWTIDEAFSSRQAKNITLQRTLISEALNPTGHGYAGSISGDVGSFHHNLLAHNWGRNWSIASGLNQANRHAGRLDIRNMVVYNFGRRTTDGGGAQVNFVGNYYKPGPATEIFTYLNPQFEHPAFGPQQYYVEGNVMEGVSGPEGPLPPFKGVDPRGEQDAPVTVPEPFFPSYVQTHTAEEAYENVLADVGCNVPMLDDHDKRVIRETREGTFTYTGRLGKPGIPDSQEDVGGWEDYPETHRAADWDADADGMPGAWEAKHGLDPNDPADGAVDPDGDGYTNLERYLNWLAAGNTLAP